MNEMAAKFESDSDVQEFKEALADSKGRLTRKMRSAFLIGASFAFFVVLTFLFTDKGPFHSYWSPYGKVADILSMILLIPAVVSVAVVWDEWNTGRTIRKDFKELQEDRYGVTQK